MWIIFSFLRVYYFGGESQVDHAIEGKSKVPNQLLVPERMPVPFEVQSHLGKLHATAEQTRSLLRGDMQNKKKMLLSDHLHWNKISVASSFLQGLFLALGLCLVSRFLFSVVIELDRRRALQNLHQVQPHQQRCRTKKIIPKKHTPPRHNTDPSLGQLQ